MTNEFELTESRYKQLIAEADAARTKEELERAQQELKWFLHEGFTQTESASKPYAAALEMTGPLKNSFGPQLEGGAEAGFGDFVGGVAVDVANALARAERRVSFRLKTLFGFKGIRLAEEGDSWTQYPLLLEDIVDQLDRNGDIAVFSVGAAGDLVANMAQKKEYLPALRTSRADGLLLSGGGNDLFGDLGGVLRRFFAGATPEELIDGAAFDALLNEVIAGYNTILTDVAAGFPGLPVFGHGYDLPFPQDDGKWIGPVLQDKGIPFDIGRNVLGVMMNRFNEALLVLQDQHANFVFSDLREKVDRGPNSWFDELHPKNAGYARAALELETTIRHRLAGGAELATGGPVAESLTGQTGLIVLDPGHGGMTAVGGSSANNAVGPAGTLEKALTLDVAKRARDILVGRGHSVMLTREGDSNLGLADRAAIARVNKAAVFVSIHFNASSGHTAQGTETFVHSALRSAGGSAAKALCRAVQAEMVAALGHRDRNALHPGGLKFANFGVLKPAHHDPATAATLHEVSFLDRADEESRLLTVSYRRRVATALADGIETYLQGLAGAESLGMTEAEIEDATQLSDDTPEVVAPPLLPPTDVSNGHMIAGAESVGGSFLRSLAEIEARFIRRRQAGGDEGNETADLDPAVADAFQRMGADPDANMAPLGRIFGAAETGTGFDLAAFAAFIESLNLSHFSAGEFLVLGGQNNAGPCAGKNHFPDRSLWRNIANTAIMIDRIRDRLGAAVTISSAYRSPAYNTCIGGAPASLHMRFNALDWSCATGSPSQWASVARQVSDSDPARFRGFIKPYATFVHIDTRDTL